MIVIWRGETSQMKIDTSTMNAQWKYSHLDTYTYKKKKGYIVCCGGRNGCALISEFPSDDTSANGAIH